MLRDNLANKSSRASSDHPKLTVTNFLHLTFQCNLSHIYAKHTCLGIILNIYYIYALTHMWKRENKRKFKTNQWGKSKIATSNRMHHNDCSLFSPLSPKAIDFGNTTFRNRNFSQCLLNKPHESRRTNYPVNPLVLDLEVINRADCRSSI